jgi:hypothetical protein
MHMWRRKISRFSSRVIFFVSHVQAIDAFVVYVKTEVLQDVKNFLMDELTA